MRGEFRRRVSEATQVLLACAIAGAGLVAIASGVPDSSNIMEYWK